MVTRHTSPCGVSWRLVAAATAATVTCCLLVLRYVEVLRFGALRPARSRGGKAEQTFGSIRIPVRQIDPPKELLARVASIRTASTRQEELRPVVTEDGEIVDVPQRLPLVDVSRKMYSGLVQLGMPMQNFNIVFDTGSSNLWVADKSCTRCNARGRQKYDKDASSTYTEGPAGNRSFRIDYGAGSCTGSIALDTVHIAELRLDDVPFMQVEEETEPFLSAPFDGVMGLGFDGIVAPKHLNITTPLDVMVSKYGELFDDKVFSFFMQEKAHDAAELVIGRIDQDRYPSGINWLNILKLLDGSYGYWAVTIAAAELRGGETVPLVPKRPAVMDSGTTCIVMPSEDYQRFLDHINKSSVSSSCSSYPTIAIQLGLREYELTGHDYGFQEPGRCQICVQSDSYGGAGFWVLGAVFHRKYAVTYDFGANPPRIGIPNSGEKIPIRSPWFSLVIAGTFFGLGFAALMCLICRMCDIDLEEGSSSGERPIQIRQLGLAVLERPMTPDQSTIQACQSYTDPRFQGGGGGGGAAASSSHEPLSLES